MQQQVHPRLGSLKDPEDPRDFPMKTILRSVAIPPIVDWENKTSPVKDQGNRGACVAFASCAVKEFQEKKQRRFRSGYDFSEEWIYRQIMQPGGGAYNRDAFKVLNDHGVPRERYMPYDPNLPDDVPPEFNPTGRAKWNARFYKAQHYARVSSFQNLLESLYINGPLLIGVSWLEGWFDPQNKDHHGYPILTLGDGNSMGGHAISLVGYDQERRLIKFKNSWGNGWGKDGYGLFTFDLIEKNWMDAWATFDINNKLIDTEAVQHLVEEKDKDDDISS